MMENRGRVKRIVIAVSMTIAMVAGPTIADDSTDKAETILDAFVSATGGLETYDAVQTRVSKVKFEISGIPFSATTHLARPARSHTIIEAAPVGTIEKGTDGEVVWENSLMTGPVVKEGDERIIIIRGSNLDSAARWREVFDGIEYLGTVMIDETSCHKIRMIASDGGPDEIRYFDEESGLLMGTDIELELPMGTILMRILVDDYRDVGGVLLPHRIRQVVAGNTTEVHVESIEQNVEIAEEHFELPSEIRALVEKKAAAAAE